MVGRRTPAKKKQRPMGVSTGPVLPHSSMNRGMIGIRDRCVMYSHCGGSVEIIGAEGKSEER